MREPYYSLYEHPANDTMPQRLSLSTIIVIFLCGSAMVALIVFLVLATSRIMQ